MCHNIWSTIEAIDYLQALSVRKSASQIEPFVREKLLISVYESCKHRPHALEDAQALTATVITKLLTQVKDATLSIQEIIATTGTVLQHFDHAAHVHYSAYHQV